MLNRMLTLMNNPKAISYEKGREFEEQFAKFMKKKLNWHKVRVGAAMTGRSNAKGTSIDVFGERLDEKGERYSNLANKWMIGSGVLFVFAVAWFIAKIGENGIGFMILSLSLLICGVSFKLLSDAYNKQNAWVECKNLKSKATVSHVNKMLNEFRDFKSSKNDEHKFTHLYFVSANGYVENALKLALDNKIVCYEKNGSSFIEVKYWN